MGAGSAEEDFILDLDAPGNAGAGESSEDGPRGSRMGRTGPERPGLAQGEGMAGTDGGGMETGPGSGRGAVPEHDQGEEAGPRPDGPETLGGMERGTPGEIHEHLRNRARELVRRYEGLLVPRGNHYELGSGIRTRVSSFASAWAKGRSYAPGAAERGTRIHNALAWWAVAFGNAVAPAEVVAEAARRRSSLGHTPGDGADYETAPLVSAFRQFLTATGLVTIATELPLASDIPPIAGTLDFLLADDEGNTTVLDVKTGYAVSWHVLQVLAYAHLLQSNGFPVSSGAILYLGIDGRYNKLVTFPVDKWNSAHITSLYQATYGLWQPDKMLTGWGPAYMMTAEPFME